MHPVRLGVQLHPQHADYADIRNAAARVEDAGFDILYACLDAEFDRREGLQSIPARLGVARALAAARWLHAAALVSLLLVGPVFGMKGAYLAAVAMIAVLMAVEHRLVRPDDLSRVPVAFFHVNSLISITLLLGVLADEIIRRWA